MPEKADEFTKSIEYIVDYRDIRYPRLEYKTGSLLLVLPKDYEKETALLEKHKRWIMQKEQAIRQALEEAKNQALNVHRTHNELKKLVESIVKRYKQEDGFEVNQVFFRRMKTKWGSFSPKRNLTINTLLKYLPEKLIEYVIFHELAHSKERKHNETFWKIINRRFKDPQKYEKGLLVYWFLVQRNQP